jgi:hypothetical protein
VKFSAGRSCLSLDALYCVREASPGTFDSSQRSFVALILRPNLQEDPARATNTRGRMGSQSLVLSLRRPDDRILFP